ncbi:hypothetical protein DJ62_2246 [Yersinia enterocolitica]|nr:hypothetical protein DJ61_272 [Yersinia enterocolitica]KGA72541.1 hypothetical protein DJ62_2246 [Yersinia enterocolitica]
MIINLVAIELLRSALNINQWRAGQPGSSILSSKLNGLEER